MKALFSERYLKSVQFLSLCWLVSIQCAVVPKPSEVDQQGLYHKKDKVTILTHANLEQNIYGKPHAWLVQFYNSNCGHCRNLAPKFKTFASEVFSWNRVVHLGVLDCQDDENNADCRNFEINAYPTMRYFHENYVKGNNNLGDDLKLRGLTPEALVQLLLVKLQEQQLNGHLMHAPSLEYSLYRTLTDAMRDVPSSVKYTFMIFDNPNSTLGPMVALDMSDYSEIAVRLVDYSSHLTTEQNIARMPSLIAVRNDLQTINLTPKNTDRESIIHAIDVFLLSKNIRLPKGDRDTVFLPEKHWNDYQGDGKDGVLLDDLETALDTTLRFEISRLKVVEGEALYALRNLINVLIDYFPFRANGKAFMLELKQKLASADSITGDQIERWVKESKQNHEPVFSTPLKYVKCLGSESRYRGHTCGLWTMFHTMTVAASSKKGGSGPDVLSAMHGYVRHFFACSHCSMHFQQMAQKNNMSAVKENDKAVLWLWIAHNEVNLRIAGDETEDPKHPKVQFPRAERCGECRQSNGAWRLDEVYRYLRRVYDPMYLRSQAPGFSSEAPLSSLDLSITTALPTYYLEDYRGRAVHNVQSPVALAVLVILAALVI